MAGRVKEKKGELLSDFQVEKVHGLLNREEDPITKKEACQLLNINYNTTRLAKIIDSWQERKRAEKERRKIMRNKPVQEMEMASIITSSLQGESLEDISRRTYRSVAKIKSLLEEAGVPRKAPGGDYFHPEMIPDELLREEYEVGEFVWSARYNGVAEIIYRKDHHEHGPIYKMWILGPKCQYVDQPWYELGHLDCLKKYNISANKLVD